ncbi:MAG: hypothetical protein ABWZ66_06850 [Pyrinomonadaceae bacterium]
MNLQILLLGLTLMLSNLTFAQCEEMSFQTSKLPKKMPADVEMIYYENGGLLNAHLYIGVKGDALNYEEKRADEESSRKWTAKISVADKERIYRTFVENKFDLIKNDKMDGIVYDAPSHGVAISFGGQSFRINSGMNSPLSGENQIRYSNVEGDMLSLISQYSAKSKDTSDNFVVLYYNPQNESWLFRNAKETALNEKEIAEIENLLKKAVDEYNAKQKEPQKIDLPKYKRQFVAVINNNGEKEVWANCFAGDFENWRKKIVMVDDGGKYFFNVKINLTKKIHYDFMVNGTA